MPHSTSPSPNPSPLPFTIPSVDISPFLHSPESAAAQVVVKQINHACRTSGFFQITNHGISKALRDAVLNAAKEFFRLPLEEKVKYHGGPGTGYERIGEQILEEGTRPELKEGYFISRDVPDRAPPYGAFEKRNVWPTPIVPDSIFKEPILQYHSEVTALANHIMSILALGLPEPDAATKAFEEFSLEPIASVRLLHYPPHPKDAPSDLRGAGAHTDFGAITLLLQGGASGLQVLNRDGGKDGQGEWVDVPPDAEAYVVNVGDMLERWTGGEYRSTLHRVINTSGTDRYSVPFFFDGNVGFRVRRFGDEEDEGFTVEQHMMDMYHKVYVK